MGARDVYTALCKEMKCRVNSNLAAALPSGADNFSIEVLDLSTNMVGPKGIVPIIQVAKLSPTLRKVDLRDNYLDNPAVRAVTLALLDHPAVESIDFSRNPISWSAGMSILELVTHNNMITHVGVDGTFLKERVIETISERTAQNLAIQARKKAKGPNPTNHPTTIRMRALKRLFNELLAREGQDGMVPRRCVVEGYKENMRMQSREQDLEMLSVAFYEELKRRCNADEHGMITWDTFLIISMVDDIGFSADEVDQIKTTFEKFDTDGNGFIDLFELRRVIEAVTGQVPTDSFVREKLLVYDADGSNTITLDEFLIMMVDKGPQPGSTTLVPQVPPSQRSVRHL
eukprot:TRINITY_DN39858_c0_g1_i1.p1 TRINITY_DN39858_c0_g1~~TRINITY_DN39858_c0_g1_i1.p1  ORF type:complete len:378 (+),score=91.84 TRINITY_DN39858_c0_g1_i1:103-1134(+)